MATSNQESRTSRGVQLDVHHILSNGGSPSSTQPSSSSSCSNQTAMRGKKWSDLPTTRPKAYSSSSSNNTHTSTSTKTVNRVAQRDVRTLPSWIDSFEERSDSLENSRPRDRLLTPPSRAYSTQHHHTPSQLPRRVSQDGFVDTYDDVSHGMNERKAETGFFGSHRDPVKGRKWDHARDGDPVIMQSGVIPTSSPWRTYIVSSMYGPATSENTKLVNENLWQKQTQEYERPWRGDLDGNGDPEKLSGLLHGRKKRRNFFSRCQHLLLMHPLVPLVFRLIVLTTSTIALGLSSSVHVLSSKYSYPQSPSSIMAIVVDVVGIPYILYVTWDEYTGKPLGLRSPKAKIRLVLLDLFFIIFESANLALAFASLADGGGACKASDTAFNYIICNRVKALCGILMVALIAWSITFAVSIFRLVERVGGREESD